MSPDDTVDRDYILSNKVYDYLKTLAIIIIPALATLYITVAAIWSLGSSEEVSGTAVALSTFLGVIVKLGDKSFNESDGKFDGVVNVGLVQGKQVISLEVPGDPQQIVNQDTLTLKVNPPA